MRRDARLSLRLVLNQHVRPRPAATQTTAAPRLRRVGLRLHAAGGKWTDYRRQSRKDVLRLRSLVLRGRARTRRRATGASDPVVARVLRLPNEMCWNVLKFWRATSAATGEVI